MSCGRQGPNWSASRLRLRICGARRKRPAITSDDVAPDAFWSGFPVVLMRGSVLEHSRLGGLPSDARQAFHRGFTSEDTTFFYRAHKAGIKFAVDLRVKVPHVKVRGIEPFLSGKEREGDTEFEGGVDDAPMKIWRLSAVRQLIKVFGLPLGSRGVGNVVPNHNTRLF